MARYSIDEKTLTDIADAVRAKVGIEGSLKYVQDVVCDTDKITVSLENLYGQRFRITVSDIVLAEGCGYIQMNWTGPDSLYGSAVNLSTNYSGVERLNPKKLIFFSQNNIIGSTFHLVVEAVDENDIPYTQTPQEMIETINNLPTPPTESELTFTGDCSYRCANGGWDWFIEKYGNLITTKNITSARHMFNDAGIKKIPFEINFNSSTTVNASNMFASSNLTEIPILNGFKPLSLDYMFNTCGYFVEFPEDYATNWDWSYLNSQTSGYTGNESSMFVNCFSLRKLPMAVFAGGNPYVSYSYAIFNAMANGCQFLDEIIDLPNPHYKATFNQSGYANVFNSTIKDCFRLKNFTFAKMEPMNWAQQVLDFSTYAGWASKTPNGIYRSFNHGEFKPGHITADKEVIDDATYQALKNDPDWWSKNVAYSRYNHDSAVATINSLPDCSAYQTSSGKAANTIKFKGAAGELTDGGAINTLTEEEIAVAAAKGWTVSLV